MSIVSVYCSLLVFILVLTIICSNYHGFFALQFDQVRSEMQDLWLKFTELSVFDYREAVVPLARMYQWVSFYLKFLSSPTIQL